jgi:hypothetical protein
MLAVVGVGALTKLLLVLVVRVAAVQAVLWLETETPEQQILAAAVVAAVAGLQRAATAAPVS